MIIVIAVIGKVKGHGLLAADVVFEDDLNKNNNYLFLTILLFKYEVGQDIASLQHIFAPKQTVIFLFA